MRADARKDNPSGGSAFETNHRPQNDSLIFDYKLGWGHKENRTGRVIDPKSYMCAHKRWLRAVPDLAQRRVGHRALQHVQLRP